MAIQQTRKDALEKRLKLLRQQVYGEPYRYTDTRVKRPDESFTSDITYLHQDLLKIVTLSSLAIGAQIILKLFLKPD